MNSILNIDSIFSQELVEHTTPITKFKPGGIQERTIIVLRTVFSKPVIF